MALVIKDRIKETTTTTGTGDMSLGGADATFDTFSSCMSNSDTTYYAIVHTTYNTDEWEVGLGTYNSSTNALARTTVLAGSNGTSAVNFSAGDKNIFVTFPADATAGKAILGLGTAATADTTDFVAVTGDAMTGNPSFGDGDKAIFGVGSDLQIYHNSGNNHSYITESNATGSLFIQGANVYVQDADYSNSIVCRDNAEVELFYSGLQRLETSATGVDITGSLDVTDVATTQTNLDVDPAGTAVALAIALG